MLEINFGRKIRRVARRQCRRGKLDQVTYEKIKSQSYSPQAVARWKLAIESQCPTPPWMAKKGLEPDGIMERIWAWLIANWPTVLRIIISLLILLDEPPKAEEEPEEEPEEKTEEKPEENE